MINSRNPSRRTANQRAALRTSMEEAARLGLVFTVLLVEFRSFLEPIAIVIGALLSMVGTVAALWITGTSMNVVSLLGLIIGIGIVAKNGILMLDLVEHHRAEGASLEDALKQSGRRRLRPVLMTSMAAALGMLPLAQASRSTRSPAASVTAAQWAVCAGEIPSTDAI